MRVGAAMGVRRRRRPAGVRGPGRRGGPRQGRGEPAPAGRRPAGRQAADPPARAAHEGHRGRLRVRCQRVHRLLQRAAPGGLPGPGPRSRLPAARPGGVAADRPPRRGAAAGRDRPVRPGLVLRDVPQGLRAGVGPDGERPGPAGQPAAHRGRLRAPDVLPEVRAPAVPGLQEGRAAQRVARGHAGGAGNRRGAQRAVRHRGRQADRGRAHLRLLQGERLRLPEGLRLDVRRAETPLPADLSAITDCSIRRQDIRNKSQSNLPRRSNAPCSRVCQGLSRSSLAVACGAGCSPGGRSRAAGVTEGDPLDLAGCRSRPGPRGRCRRRWRSTTRSAWTGSPATRTSSARGCSSRSTTRAPPGAGSRCRWSGSPPRIPPSASERS